MTPVRVTSNGDAMTEEALVGQLAELGLTRNQALAYLTLLRDDGAEGLTGYEVGTRSGVPRSAAYKVLRQLEEHGAAFAVGEDPQRFHAAEPRRWLDRVRRSTLVKVDNARQALEALPARTRPEPLWIVRRYDDVLQRICEMILGAEESIYLSLWARELDAVRGALRTVADRGLHKVLHCPERLGDEPPGFLCWVDDLAGDAGKTEWSHKAIVVVDRREALVGGAEPDADNDAVWTTNPSLVDVATNHIILDITLMSRAQGRDAFDTVAPMMRTRLGGEAG